MKTTAKLGTLPILIGLALLSSPVQAQRAEFDRTQQFIERFKERAVLRIQEILDVSDSEWSVLKPLVADVIEKQWANRANRSADFSGRRGRGGDDDENRRFQRRGNAGESRERESGRNRSNRTGRGGNADMEGLRNAIDSGDAGKIQAELAAYRAVQKKRAVALKKAREKLRQVLTLKQEANLVLVGLLD